MPVVSSCLAVRGPGGAPGAFIFFVVLSARPRVEAFKYLVL